MKSIRGVKYGRRDEVSKSIISTFLQQGAKVADLQDVGRGIPDLLIGVNGHMAWVEMKSAKGKYTEPQIKFKEQWSGYIYECRSDIEAIEICRRMRSI